MSCLYDWFLNLNDRTQRFKSSIAHHALVQNANLRLKNTIDFGGLREISVHYGHKYFLAVKLGPHRNLVIVLIPEI